MPSTYTDQFFRIDPGNPPSSGTKLSVQELEYTDRGNDGYISPKAGDTVNGLKVTHVWVDDQITVNIPGEGDVQITGVTFYLKGDVSVFTPTDGTNLQDATFVSSTYVTKSTKVQVSDLEPACFTKGTLIETARGPCPVEALCAGDMIRTWDHGLQPLLHLSAGQFRATGRFAPVRICKGALGADRDLLVSQQHRMLICDWRAQIYFGQDEVLVAAKHLINGDTIHLQPGGMVTYYHLLFARHEVVWGNGIPSESYFPARFAQDVDEGSLAELDLLFPELLEHPAAASTARPVVPGACARILAET